MSQAIANHEAIEVIYEILEAIRHPLFSLLADCCTCLKDFGIEIYFSENVFCQR